MADNDKDSQELAEDRTDWAEDRTLLANERTFLSWMGTGLGSIGLAVGMQAVFGATEPTWLAKLAASVFLVLAIGLFSTGYRNCQSAHDRLTAHAHENASTTKFKLVATGACIGALGVGVVLWML